MALAEAVEAAKEKQQQERDRLLYVAMTRAEVWLIVCAAGDLGKDGQSWYETCANAMQDTNAAPHDFAFGQGRRFQSGDWPRLASVRAEPQERRPAVLPGWVHRPALQPSPIVASLSPSDLGGAKALSGIDGQDEETAKRYGTLVHLALERLADLPVEARAKIPSEEVQAQAHREACTVLARAEVTPLFAPGTLPEVAVSGNIEGMGRLHGVIDRLIVSDAHVQAIDFKTNATVPRSPEEVPEGILRQMGAYAALLKPLYPKHEIRTGILWTRSATLMMLPHDLVTAALARTTSP